MAALHKFLPEDDGRALMTVAEYLRLCEQTGLPYEYLHGRVYLMAGSKPLHSRIVVNTIRTLEDALGSDGPCYVYGPDARVQVAEDVIFLTDVTVSCEESDEDADMIYQPKVVVEVFSQSTEEYDRGHKLLHYMECPSIQAIIFVDSKRKLVTVDQKFSGKWEHWPYYTGGVIPLSCLDVEIPVDAIYHNIPVV